MGSLLAINITIQRLPSHDKIAPGISAEHAPAGLAHCYDATGIDEEFSASKNGSTRTSQSSCDRSIPLLVVRPGASSCISNISKGKGTINEFASIQFGSLTALLDRQVSQSIIPPILIPSASCHQLGFEAENARCKRAGIS